MACGVTLFSEEFDLPIPSTQANVKFLGPKFALVGAKDVDFLLELYRLTSNGQVVPVVADMIARTDLVSTLNNATGTVGTAAGAWHFVYDCTTTTNKYFGQCGIAGQLASGTTPGYAKGRLTAILRACAAPGGGRQIEVDPNQTFAAPHIYPLGRVPAAGADKVRLALVVNAAKDLEYVILARGVVDPEAPGAWVTIGSFAALSDGASGVCTTDASLSGVTPASYHLLELAVAVRMKSGGSAPAGFVKAVAGVSYT